MGLDVDAPAPPELEYVDPNEYEDASVAADADYRREELEAFLHDGAWERAFEEWADHADMSEEQFRIAGEMELFEEFDFFWDDFADRVGYHAPGIPEDWKERTYHTDLDSWGTVSGINAGLTELGQIVCEVLKDEYIDWEADYEPPEDLPDF
ncbi:hypothetical protein [Haloarchaeobius iranensis]|uniref:DUF7992 domain-containing protein n=1 Tax=Haloarchaeobius iranensis TaxID=996166 RepID=A0A1H0ART1_9EURY|nr:hypothetical protein [Haloarchaeobius iranensis]SDN36059.1 hypothetical protein SAMN05192554_12916 [Haloarchaeobius iranensis]